MGVRAGGGSAGHDGRQNFAAGRDAVSELADADCEGQQPDHHELPNRPLTGGYQPSDQGDQPAANNATPENVRGGMGDCLDTKVHQLGSDFWTQGRGTYRQQREQQGSANIGYEYDRLQAEHLGRVLPDFARLVEDEYNRVEGIFGKQLGPADDYDDETHRVDEEGNKFFP